jgi:hypothetical protein
VTTLARIDHLVYAAPNLAAASTSVAGWLGVTPAAGGRHVGVGTRNELLGLGDGSYLEIIGPDPEQPPPAAPRPFGLDELDGPRLMTWGARTTDIDAAIAAARAAGHDPGDARSMQRARPDGVLLSWRLTGANGDGVVPFLIDWGDTPHPAASAPTGVELVALELTHPAPERVQAVLDAWGLGDVRVAAGDAPSVRARLRGPNGDLVLA